MCVSVHMTWSVCMAWMYMFIFAMLLNIHVITYIAHNRIVIVYVSQV